MFGIDFKKIDLQKMPIKKIVIIGQFAVILFCVRSCHLRDLIINSNGLEIKMYEGKANEFASTVNKLGEKVSTQDQMIAQKTKELEKSLLKNSTLTTLNEQIKFEATTKIRDVMAAYSGNGPSGTEVIVLHDTINGKDTIIEGIKTGTKFKADTSKWYSIAGSIEKNGVKIDSLNFKSDFTMNIGQKRVKGYKGWLLGKKEPKVELVNPNPYTTIDVMKNIKLEDNKWWENGWIKFGLGGLFTFGLIEGVNVLVK